MPKLSPQHLGQLLHKSRHEQRTNLRRFLKSLGGTGSAEELDQALATAAKSKEATAVADGLDQLRKHTLRAVEQGMSSQVAEMIACVRLEMERQGLTQSDLGARCKMPQPMISNYLAGKREPTVSNLAKIATALGCSWRLVGGVDGAVGLNSKSKGE
jgi:antitoxin component HigA of HigAB toxin-antitoxin module